MTSCRIIRIVFAAQPDGGDLLLKVAEVATDPLRAAALRIASQWLPRMEARRLQRRAEEVREPITHTQTKQLVIEFDKCKQQLLRLRLPPCSS